MQDLAEDEELFAIPQRVVLLATTSSLPAEVHSELPGIWLPLIVTIVHEYLKGPGSSWYPYFQVLPTTFDTPMFWNEHELRELQGSAVLGKIGKENAEEEWNKTIIPLMLQHPDLFPVHHDTAKLIELAHMAGSLIMAYAFDIDRDEDNEGEDGFEEDDEEEPLKGMVPFADMLNADADRNNARVFQEDDYLVMKTIKPVKAGEQLFNDYGPLPRSDLLRMYGYTTDNYAQYDVVEFGHDLILNVASLTRPAQRAWLKKEQQLDEIGIIDDGYSFPRPAQGESIEEVVPGNVHMILRSLTFEPESTKLPKVKSDESLTIQETALLSAVATKRLTEYATPVEHDRKLLADLPSTTPANISQSRFKAALEVRIGEKEVLLQIIQLCQAHIASMTNEVATNDDKKRKRDGDDHKPRKTPRTNGHG